MNRRGNSIIKTPWRSNEINQPSDRHSLTLISSLLPSAENACDERSFEVSVKHLGEEVDVGHEGALQDNGHVGCVEEFYWVGGLGG